MVLMGVLANNVVVDICNVQNILAKPYSQLTQIFNIAMAALSFVNKLSKLRSFCQNVHLIQPTWDAFGMFSTNV